MRERAHGFFGWSGMACGAAIKYVTPSSDYLNNYYILSVASVFFVINAGYFCCYWTREKINAYTARLHSFLY